MGLIRLETRKRLVSAWLLYEMEDCKKYLTRRCFVRTHHLLYFRPERR